MASSSTFSTFEIYFASNVSNPSLFTTHVNVHLPIDKLDGKNYATWASNVKLWLESQGYLDHLTLKVIDIALHDFSCWKRVDAHLCMILKSTIQSSLKQMFRTYDTYYEVWEHTKLLYTNDISIKRSISSPL